MFILNDFHVNANLSVMFLRKSFTYDTNKFVCFESVDVDIDILDKRNRIMFYAP